MSNDPRTAAQPARPSPDPFGGLRYYPAFIVVCPGSFLFLAGPLVGALIHALDQVLVPRLHPVDLRADDVIEVGSSGGYRPVRVRHPDGSVTDAGEMPKHLAALRLLPVALPVGLVWLLCIHRLARRWPKAAADPGGAAGSPRADPAEPAAAPDRRA